MSTSYTAPEVAVEDTPTIVELKARGVFLPALVKCAALDGRRRQLPSATLALHERHELRRARYVRADGRETEVWFNNTGYTLLDEIAPEHLTMARKRYRIPEPAIEAPPSCPTCGSDGSPCADCNPIPANELAELALEARAVLLDEQAARDAEAEQLIAEMRELDTQASDIERRAGEAVRGREHERGRMLQAEAWALADRYYQRWARLSVLGYTVTQGLDLDRLPSPAPAYDGCVRCIAPATLTIRFSGGDLVRLCASCFERHYQRNEYLAVAWEVVEARTPLHSLEQLMGWPERGGYQEYNSDSDKPVAPRQNPPICAGSRVEVAFGPDAGQVGTVMRSLDHTGYVAVTLDRPGPWAEHLYLPEEIRPSLVPPPEERPWANDEAYAALG